MRTDACEERRPQAACLLKIKHIEWLPEDIRLDLIPERVLRAPSDSPNLCHRCSLDLFKTHDDIPQAQRRPLKYGTGQLLTGC